MVASSAVGVTVTSKGLSSETATATIRFVGVVKDTFTGAVIVVSCPSEPIAVTLTVNIPSSYTLVADSPGLSVVGVSLASSPNNTSKELAPVAVGATVTVPESSCEISIFAITFEGAANSSIGSSSSLPHEMNIPVATKRNNTCFKIFIIKCLINV